MLSNREKKEMLADARSKTRRDNFRFARREDTMRIGFDDYLVFLNGIQIFFSPFKISRRITVTKTNRL